MHAWIGTETTAFGAHFVYDRTLTIICSSSKLVRIRSSNLTNFMTSLWFWLTATLALSGCWSANHDVLLGWNAKIVEDFPTPLLAQYNGKSYIINQSTNSPDVYIADGLGEVRFAGLGGSENDSYIAQIKMENMTGFQYVTLISNMGLHKDTKRKLEEGKKVEFEIIAPNERIELPETVDNINDFRGFGKEVIRKTKYSHGVVSVFYMDSLPDDKKNELIAAAERKYVESRYERGVQDIFLSRCNNGTVFFEGGGISSIVGEFTTTSNACLINNGIASVRLGIDQIRNLRCDGDVGSTRNCYLEFNLFCNMNTSVANSPGLNSALCAGITAHRQPLTMRVLDDGRDLQVLNYSLR